MHINAFNFPVWGMLEKLAPDLAGRHAGHREARHRHQLPDRGHGPAHHRVRHPARRRAAAHRAAAPAICSTTSTCQDVVTFTGSRRDRPQAARRTRASSSESGALQHGGRHAQRLDARSRRRARHAGVRPLRQGGRARDDRQGGPELHRASAAPWCPRSMVDDVVEALIGKRLAGAVDRRPARGGRRAWGRSPATTQRDEVREARRRTGAEARDRRSAIRQRRGHRRRRRARAPSCRRILLLLRRPVEGPSRPRRRGLRAGEHADALRDIDDAIALAKRGKGCLVGSRRSPTMTAVAREFVLGAAAYHGRILILNRDWPRNRPATARRCPAGPRRPRPRGRRRGDGRHARRASTTCSAPRCRARPRTLTAHHRQLDARARPQPTGDVHPFRKHFEELRDRRYADHRQPHRHARRHRAFRRLHRRHLLRPHGRGRRQARTRSSPAASPTATSILSLAAGLFVDPAPGPVLANYGSTISAS